MKTKSYKRAVDGCILEIPLWGNFGFAYSKYINGSKHEQLGNLVSILKVYNKRFDKPLDDLTGLHSIEYLNPGILMAGIRPTVSKGFWKIVGKADISVDDLKPLMFKKQDVLSGEWKLTINGEETNSVDNDINWDNYEEYVYYASGSIEIRLTLLFMLIDNIKPDSYLDLENETIQYHYNSIFKR